MGSTHAYTLIKYVNRYILGMGGEGVLYSVGGITNAIR